MRFLHGRVVENGNHNQGESGYKVCIRDFRKGSVDPSSPRREASLLTWPGNLRVFGPFFFGVDAWDALPYFTIYQSLM
jgi:hypothetical protein